MAGHRDTRQLLATYHRAADKEAGLTFELWKASRQVDAPTESAAASTLAFHCKRSRTSSLDRRRRRDQPPWQCQVIEHEWPTGQRTCRNQSHTWPGRNQSL